MKTALALLILTVAIAASAATNPYVTLYEQRVRLTEAESRRQAAETQLQSRRLERARRLYNSSAMSREEYETIEADYHKSVASEDAVKAEIAEAQAMLEVVKYLVQNGQEVPLCRL